MKDYNTEPATQAVDNVLAKHNVPNREQIIQDVKKELAANLTSRGINPDNWNELFQGKGASAGSGR